ncbi:MAG: hypothetical protein JXA66_03740 [Oligoflexia bacterium]|nr:hypothetical protein [Oligoflexia bacterium]
MRAWIAGKIDMLWINRGLIKKMLLVMGIPTLFFVAVVVYLAGTGGVSNYTISGYDSDFVITDSLMRGVRLVFTSILFVIMPVYISVMALVRKSMAYRVAAAIANLFAILYLAVLF